MPDDPFSIGDLARLADVTPRTIRYYIAQGLLPGPDAAGPATRYGEGHLARLRMIRRLQRDHLPLAEIRLRLERLSDDDVVAAVTAMDGGQATAPSTGSALAFVQSLMLDAGVSPSVGPGRSGRLVTQARLAPSAVLASAIASTPSVAEPPAALASAPEPSFRPAPAPAVLAPAAPVEPRLPPVLRTTWERLVITPDVELHVRRPLDRPTNRRVDQLERIARELFDEP